MYYSIPSSPLPKLTEIYYVTRNTTWRCADKNNLLIFIKEGRCYFKVNSEEHLLEQGQAIFIPSSTPYVRKSFENSDCTLCYVHFLTQSPPMQVSEEHINTFASNEEYPNSISSMDILCNSEISKDIFISDISFS